MGQPPQLRVGSRHPALMAAPLQLQTDLIQTVTQAKYVAQRAQDAYLMRTWQGRQKHRLQFAGTLVVLMAVVSVLRLDAGLFPGWSTERLVSAAVVELMASVGLFAATYFVRGSQAVAGAAALHFPHNSNRRRRFKLATSYITHRPEYTLSLSLPFSPSMCSRELAWDCSASSC